VRPGNNRVAEPISSLEGKPENRSQQPRCCSCNERKQRQYKQPSASFRETIGFRVHRYSSRLLGIARWHTA